MGVSAVVTPEQRLAEHGLALPGAPAPLGAYVPFVRTGRLLFLSGMLPMRDAQPAVRGTIGEDLTLDEARSAARMAVLNGLAVVKAAAGGLDKVKQVVRMTVYQRTAPGFTQHAAVADAGSEILALVLGPAAGHTRMVFGVNSLPAGMPVEVELVIELKEKRDGRTKTRVNEPAGKVEGDSR